MDYEKITSRRSEIVREAFGLADSAELRKSRRAFFCEGARLCFDAAESSAEIESCFFTAQALEKYRKYLLPVLEKAGKSYEIAPPVAQLLSKTKNPQGVFCVCKSGSVLRYDLPEKPEGNSGCIVLENVQDPANVGATLRTAEAFGISDVYLLGSCCDTASPKVLRGSMGALFRLNVCAVSDTAAALSGLKAFGYTLLAAVPRGSAVKITDVNFDSMRAAVLIGNEGAGISEDALRLCDMCVTIPMAGRAESLNAAVSAAVLMWEMVR